MVMMSYRRQEAKTQDINISAFPLKLMVADFTPNFTGMLLSITDYKP